MYVSDPPTSFSPFLKTLLVWSVLCFGLSFSMNAQSQQFAKADKLYKAERYAQAIPLYRKGLKKKKSVNALTKLAQCYRMTNKMRQAEKIFEEVVAHERARPITYFYYAETLISGGKYDEAKEWLHKYTTLKPEDEKAKQLYNSCDLIATIKPFFEVTELQIFPHNTDSDDNSPVYLGDFLVFSSDKNQGVKPLKQKSGWTDRDFLQVYSSRHETEKGFSPPSPFSEKINALNKNTANACFWKNPETGVLETYFARNAAESSKRGAFKMQLFKAISTNGRSWKNVAPLNFCTPEIGYMHPSISPSGDTLFFVSDRAKRLNGTDIYFSIRKKDNTWTRPQNIGQPINTPSQEGFPYVDQSGRLYFCSKGHTGYGGFDIFVSQKDENGNWLAPQNLGNPINSPSDDISICFAPKGSRGAFTSSREGGDDDIFLFSFEPKEADFFTAALDLDTASKEKAKPQVPAIKKTASVDHKFDLDVNEKKQTTPVVEEEDALLNAINTHANTKDKTPDPIDYEQAVVSSDVKNDFSSYDDWESKATPETAKVVEDLNTTDKEEASTSLIVEKIVDNSPKEEEKEQPAIIENPVADIAFDRPKNLGVYLRKKELELGQIFRLKSNFYKKNNDEPTDYIRFELENTVNILLAYPNLVLEIACHTEAIGRAVDNLKLSQRRARAISKYLLAQGIPQQQLIAKGYGAEQLLNECNHTADCLPEKHLKNRRIELKVLDF